MFACKPCCRERGNPNPAGSTSHGPCEVCGVSTECFDIKLPPPPNPSSGKLGRLWVWNRYVRYRRPELAIAGSGTAPLRGRFSIFIAVFERIIWAMGNLFLILLVVFVYFLIVRRRDLGFLKGRYYLTLAALSLGWWIFLVIDQLRRVSTGCTPGDDMCTSGNTVSGDIIWGTILAIFSLLPVWIAAVFIGLYIQDKQKK